MCAGGAARRRLFSASLARMDPIRFTCAVYVVNFFSRNLCQTGQLDPEFRCLSVKVWEENYKASEENDKDSFRARWEKTRDGVIAAVLEDCKS